MTPSDQRTALTKTLVPLIVAWISTTVAKHLGLELDSVGLTAGVTAGVGFAYYALVSALERWEPAFGILLGTSRGPATYQAPPPTEGIAPTKQTVRVGLKELMPAGATITIKLPDPPPAPTALTLTIDKEGRITGAVAAPPPVVPPNVGDGK